MTDPGYEYYGMLAQTWDLFRGDTSKWEDRSFYLEFIQESGQPVLDVGCGTGRLLLDFLSLGMDIEGVDISAEMLDLCQRKADEMGLNPILFKGNMETMQLPRCYQTILVPSSSFQLLLTPDQVNTAIRNLYDHLLPGGSLVMPFMRLWKKGEPLEIDWHISGEKVRASDGATIRRWSKSWFDPETQLEHVEGRFEVIRNGVVIKSEHHVQSPATREYSREQALELFIKTGFIDIRIYKGFTRQLTSSEEELFTIVGKRP